MFLLFKYSESFKQADDLMKRADDAFKLPERVTVPLCKNCSGQIEEQALDLEEYEYEYCIRCLSNDVGCF
jgi:hypothetical protein